VSCKVRGHKTETGSDELFSPVCLLTEPSPTELTASEPLTLEQEYQMQQSWFEDEDSEFAATSSGLCHLKSQERLPLMLVLLTERSESSIARWQNAPSSYSPGHQSTPRTMLVCTRSRMYSCHRQYSLSFCKAEPDLELIVALPMPDGTMIGDVNLFFNDLDDPKAAEIELMIAGAALKQ
jgi:hypothetical protein